MTSCLTVQLKFSVCMETVEYPFAEVDIAVDDEHIEILAGVAERLPTAMLLGEDVPGLWDLLGQDRAKIALVVTT